jgi:hypothetical protein
MTILLLYLHVNGIQADAAASSQAVATLANPPPDGDDPISSVKRLIKLSLFSSYTIIVVRLKQLKNLIKAGKLGLKIRKWLLRNIYVFCGKILFPRTFNSNKPKRIIT